MYYCHDCKHWHTVWAFRIGGNDRECGLCDVCLENLSRTSFKDCEHLAHFINSNYGLVDYSCGLKRKCTKYDRSEDDE